eukprot:1355285-Pleurochrysis_carterae.AAC.1
MLRAQQATQVALHAEHAPCELLLVEYPPLQGRERWRQTIAARGYAREVCSARRSAAATGSQGAAARRGRPGPPWWIDGADGTAMARALARSRIHAHGKYGNHAMLPSGVEFVSQSTVKSGLIVTNFHDEASFDAVEKGNIKCVTSHLRMRSARPQTQQPQARRQTSHTAPPRAAGGGARGLGSRSVIWGYMPRRKGTQTCHARGAQNWNAWSVHTDSLYGLFLEG